MSDVAVAVRAVWRATLDGAEGEAEENFFDLGGTSLKAATMVAELRQRGIEVPLRVFFEDGRLSAVVGHAEVTA